MWIQIENENNSYLEEFIHIAQQHTTRIVVFRYLLKGSREHDISIFCLIMIIRVAVDFLKIINSSYSILKRKRGRLITLNIVNFVIVFLLNNSESPKHLHDEPCFWTEFKVKIEINSILSICFSCYITLIDIESFIRKTEIYCGGVSLIWKMSLRRCVWMACLLITVPSNNFENCIKYLTEKVKEETVRVSEFFERRRYNHSA